MADDNQFLSQLLGLTEPPEDLMKKSGGPHSVKDDATSDYELRDAIPTVSYIETPESIIQRIRQGLPLRSFRLLCEALAVPAQRLAKVLHIAPRTLARRSTFEPAESERILRLGRLYQQARNVLGNEAEARRWLLAPQWSLGGAVPLEFADTEPGARLVEDLLGQFEHGIFA